MQNLKVRARRVRAESKTLRLVWKDQGRTLSINLQQLPLKDSLFQQRHVHYVQ
jgi:hypothetical protein